MAVDPFSGDGGGGGGGGFSPSYSLLGGGASDIFSAFGQNYKAQGNRIEAEMYGRAAKFADTEAVVSESSTNIQEAQQQRQVYQGLGDVSAAIAGEGFDASGSGLDILRSSAQQGSLQAAAIKQQGLINTTGYQEQAANYRSMQKASELAAKSNESAGIGGLISGGIKIGAALAL